MSRESDIPNFSNWILKEAEKSGKARLRFDSSGNPYKEIRTSSYCMKGIKNMTNDYEWEEAYWECRGNCGIIGNLDDGYQYRVQRKKKAEEMPKEINSGDIIWDALSAAWHIVTHGCCILENFSGTSVETFTLSQGPSFPDTVMTGNICKIYRNKELLWEKK